MLNTRIGKEKAPPAVVAPKMIFISYRVIDHILWRFGVVRPSRLASPRPCTATIAVKSEGGIYVITEPDTNHGGLWWKQVDPPHTIRTGRVHLSIMCVMVIELKPVEMQCIIEEDVLGTSGQSRRLPRTNLTRAVVRQMACVKGTQHASVNVDAFITMCLISPRVTFNPVMFQKPIRTVPSLEVRGPKHIFGNCSDRNFPTQSGPDRCWRVGRNVW